MRWYGPYIALAYDWLHDAPGVDASLLTVLHAHVQLSAWVDYYNDVRLPPRRGGLELQRRWGYVIGKTLTADRARRRQWRDERSHLDGRPSTICSGTLLVGKGLMGGAAPVGTPAEGVMVGGDWGERGSTAPQRPRVRSGGQRQWRPQRAAARHGHLDPTASSFATSTPRSRTTTAPSTPVERRSQETTDVYPGPNAGPLDAVLIGPSERSGRRAGRPSSSRRHRA